MNELPEEVSKHLDWAYSYGQKRLIQVAFYAKADISRGEAWKKTELSTAVVYDRNPWRKHHTEHYWVWVIAE
jgi:hypothetical protein